MQATVTTTIPVRNGQEFILETLTSVAAQTRRPDRIVVLDNCSTDDTPQIVRGFTSLNIEYVRNPQDLGLFGNFNRCLDFAPETEFLHILHADDVLLPNFYEKMTELLEDTPGRGLAWCLDERMDETGRRLSISGKPDGRVEILEMDIFLQRKAEIGNQAFCATLQKTNCRPIPARFPMDMPILGDMVYWGKFGTHCQKIVHLHSALARYRWHGGTQTIIRAPSIDALIADEWRTMQELEALRRRPPGLVRRMKLKGLMAVRSGIKAKRFAQLGNKAYSKEIKTTAKRFTGLPLWFAGKVLVETRELIVFKIGRRRRHPANVFG